MSASRELQIAINDATTQKNVWSAELMRLNQELSKAKVGQRASLRKAIRNAETQIEDYNRLIKKLNDDLARVLKAEVKNQDNIELAKQGISPGAKIAETIGKSVEAITPVLAGQLQTKRSTDVNETPTEQKPNYMVYAIVAGIILLLMKMKK